MFILQKIKSYNYTNLVNKLDLIYLLNLTDAILTILLTSTGAFVEVNPALQSIVHTQPEIALLIKLFIPLTLIIYLSHRLLLANLRQLYISNILIMGLLTLYVIINLIHLIYVIMFVIILLLI